MENAPPVWSFDLMIVVDMTGNFLGAMFVFFCLLPLFIGKNERKGES